MRAWSPDNDYSDGVETMLRIMKQRFISERTQGFVHPETGRQVLPVAHEQAEAAWRKAEPGLRNMLMHDAQTKQQFKERIEQINNVDDEGTVDKADAWKQPDAWPALKAPEVQPYKPTADDIIDMWQKAQKLTEPERSQVIQQCIQQSKQIESEPAWFIVNCLL